MQWCVLISAVYRGFGQPPGGPGPPATPQKSHACYSCHHPFRPGTRPLACLTQGCMNLAHADLLLPRPAELPSPPQHHRNGSRRISICPHPTRAPLKQQQNHLRKLKPHDCCQHPANRLQRMQHRLPSHLLRPLPRRSQHRYQHRSLGVPSVPCHCCTCFCPNSCKMLCF